MEKNLQIQLGYIRNQKEKVISLAADLQRLQEENSRLEPKLSSAQKKRKALQKDLCRLQKIETATDSDVDVNILRDLDGPIVSRMRKGKSFIQEPEVLTAVKYQEKMERLLSMMNELLMRTIINFHTAHTEKENQERDFAQRVTDAVRARNILTEELAKIQSTVEETMRERVRQYEVIQQLEKNIAAIDAEIWLSRADSHRLSDQLTMLSTKPKIAPCCQKKESMEDKESVKENLSTFKQKVDNLLGKREDMLIEKREKEEMIISKTTTSSESYQLCDLSQCIRNALRLFNLELE